MVTDPIADMFTRIRNALLQRFSKVELPYSKIKYNIADILLKNGFISSFNVIKDASNHQVLVLTLKYKQNSSPVINEINRLSKPSKRLYIKKSEIPKAKGFGVYMLSTPKGIMCGKSARLMNVGGEVLGVVW